MSNMRLACITSCAAALFAITAGIAHAGEVKGPPDTIDNTNVTAAPAHANSICAFSGLNDYNNGQTATQTQTPADSFKYYGGGHGASGGSCKGGTNPDNPPTQK